MRYYEFATPARPILKISQQAQAPAANTPATPLPRADVNPLTPPVKEPKLRLVGTNATLPPTAPLITLAILENAGSEALTPVILVGIEYVE